MVELIAGWRYIKAGECTRTCSVITASYTQVQYSFARMNFIITYMKLRYMNTNTI